MQWMKVVDGRKRVDMAWLELSWAIWAMRNWAGSDLGLPHCLLIRRWLLHKVVQCYGHWTAADDNGSRRWRALHITGTLLLPTTGHHHAGDGTAQLHEGDQQTQANHWKEDDENGGKHAHCGDSGWLVAVFCTVKKRSFAWQKDIKKVQVDDDDDDDVQSVSKKGH